MRKRVFSLFLAFVLGISVMPMTAFAEGTDAVTEQEVQSGGDVIGYDITDDAADDDTTDEDVSGGDAVNEDVSGGDAAAEAVQALLNAPALVAEQDGEHVDHPVCGAACLHQDENGGYEHSGEAWTPISSENDFKKYYMTGNYYLTDDVTLTDGWCPADGTVLCLNGYSITLNNNNAVIAVEYSRKFTLCDCKSGGTITHGMNGNTKYTGRGVDVNPNGIFKMYGGKITDNTVPDKFGGGAYIRGTFYMYGGTISGNITGLEGGGVYVEDSGSFIMEGGSISDNKGTGQSSLGGGVYVYPKGTFLMKNGTITANTSSRGGGVYVEDSGSFHMNGGTITGNTATNPGSETGGGVYVASTGIFTMSGAVQITGNNNNGVTNNVYLDGQTITITGKLDENAGIGVTTFTRPNLIYPVTFARAGTDYTLTEDDVARFTSDKAYFPFLVDNEAKLYKTEIQNHPVCGRTCDHPDDEKHPDVIWTAISSLDMIKQYGSGYYYLTDNVTLSDTVDLSGYASVHLCLNGKTITGGGLVCQNYTLCDCVGGGKITGSTSAEGCIKLKSGTFDMYGGSITGNETLGVYVDGGTFNMHGGEITENNDTGTDGCAGGVYVKDGVMSVAGNVKITGNKMDGTTSNVCLPTGKTLTVNGALTEEASIGVITETPIDAGDEAVVVVGADGYTLTAVDLEAFASDNGYTKVLQDDANSIIFQNGVHRHFICGEENCSDDHGTSVKWKAISSLNEITAGGYYFLKGNVILTDTWNCRYTGVKLCLNGYEIIDKYGWSAITVASGASLDITDCQKDGKITLETGRTASYGGINVKGLFVLWDGSITGYTGGYGGMYVDKGTFIMNGGSITENTGGYGGMYIDGGTFTMNGGSITENIGGVNGSGGVYVDEGIFTMNGGDITGNTCDDNGGGVYVSKGTFTMNGGGITGNTGGNGGGVYVTSDGTFHMTDGKITGNVNIGGYGGGGVCVDVGTITMTGGTITGNNTTASNDRCAGGAYVTSSPNTFAVSGTAQIIGNWKNGDLQNGVYKQGNAGTASNVCLKEDKTITIEAGLTESARIGVSKSEDQLPGAGEEVVIATGAMESLNYENIFTLDLEDPYYSVVHDNKGNVSIRRHLHDWKYEPGDDGKTITAVCTADHCPNRGGAGGSVTIAAPEGTFVYDGSARKVTVVASDDWQGPEVNDITIIYNCNGEMIKSPTRAGKYIASITLGEATASASYEIDKATLTASDFVFSKPENLTYDGEDKIEELVFDFDKKILRPSPGISGLGGSYTRFYKVDDPDTPVEPLTDAGTYIVKIDLYEGMNYLEATGLTDPSWTFTINKAAGGILPTYNFHQKFFDLTEKTCTPDYSGLPADQNWTYTLSTAAVSGSVKVRTAAMDPATGALAYELSDGAAGDTVSWTVTISNPNYEDFTEELFLTLTEKEDQAALTIIGDTTVVYGQTLKLNTIGGSGTGKVTYSIDKDNSTGEASIDADGILIPVRAGTVAITAAKAGDADYNGAVSKPFVITITKANPTGEPRYTVITTTGKTLSDAGLTLKDSTLNPTDGTLEWIDDAGNVMPGNTKVEVNKAYKWRFIPMDINYNVLTGEITPYPVYSIINGAGSSWIQNTNGTLAIRGNGAFAKFQRVKVDGTVIDASNYTVTEGSTIITLKADYLKTLSEGSHTFEIVWTDGSASTGFTVVKNTSGNDMDDGDESDDKDSSGNSDNGGSGSTNSSNSANDNTANGGNATQAWSTSPNTGDPSGIWLTLFVISLTGFAGMFILRRKTTRK